MRGTPTVLKDFSGGLNFRDDPVAVPLDQAVDLLNVEPNGTHGLHRRRAISQLSPGGVVTTGATGSAPYYLHLVNGNLFWTDNTSLYRFGQYSPPAQFVNLGAYAPQGTGAIFAGAASGGQGPYYMLNGSGTAKQWNGTAAVLSNWTASTGSVPTAWSGVYAGNRAIVTNDASGTNPQRVWASAPGDPRNWGTGTGQGWFVDLDSELSPTKAVCACGPYVLVFKGDRVYVIYDLDTGANRVLTNIGATFPSSTDAHPKFVQLDQDAYWLGRDSVYRTNGQSVEKLSGTLGPAFFELASTGDQLAAIPGFIAYFLAAFGYLFILDLATGAWWRHSVTADARLIGSRAANAGTFSLSATPEFIIMRPAVAAVDQWQPMHRPSSPGAGGIDGSVSPVTFTASWTGGRSDLGVLGQQKRIRAVRATGAVGAGSLSVAMNTQSATGSARSLGLTASDYSYASVPSPWGVGRLWQVALSDAVTSSWTLDELEIDWQRRRG